MPSAMLLAAATSSIALLTACFLLVVYFLSPKASDIKLTSWPSPAWLYCQAALTLLTKGKTGGSSAPTKGQRLQVSLTRPVGFQPSRFAAFLRFARFNGTAGSVPLSYPIVEAFRLVIQVMLLPAFPFNVLGSVLARNTTTMYRAVQLDEQLVYSVHVDTGAVRTTPKGDKEVDLVCVAVSARDSGVVWRSSTTAIILGPRRPGKRAEPDGAAGTAAGQAGAAVGQAPAGSQLQVQDTWRLGSDTGRRYGLLNGDLNPIHLYSWTSRLFGFKRPIAHALGLVARAEAALHNAGACKHMAYPATLSTEFKRPTLLPATLAFAWVPPASLGTAVAENVEGITFAVLTHDGSKEVLTGRLGRAVSS